MTQLARKRKAKGPSSSWLFENLAATEYSGLTDWFEHLIVHERQRALDIQALQLTLPLSTNFKYFPIVPCLAHIAMSVVQRLAERLHDASRRICAQPRGSRCLALLGFGNCAAMRLLCIDVHLEAAFLAAVLVT